MSEDGNPVAESVPRPGTAGSSGVRIRAARPEELRAIGDLTAAAYVAGGFVNPDGAYLPHLRNAAARMYEAELIVAVLAGEPAGTVTYCRHGSPWAELAAPGEAEFRMLAVSPTAQGIGLGGTLVRRCVARAREDGCTVLRLSSEPGMHVAHRIYERLGFTRTPERDWRPGPDVDLLTYALAL